jgi:hypothetical protein
MDAHKEVNVHPDSTNPPVPLPEQQPIAQHHEKVKKERLSN